MVLTQTIADADLVWIAWQRDQVLQRKVAGLGNAPTDLRKHDPIGFGIKPLIASGVLNWLEGYAAYTAPLQGEADDVGDLAVVDPLLKSHHQVVEILARSRASKAWSCTAARSAPRSAIKASRLSESNCRETSNLGM